MKTIKIHSGNILGKIKPMHGVGGGPVTDILRYDATEEFRAAGIPFSRTHDIEGPFSSGEFIDIPNIFKDFDKDVDDPASYNFTMTDFYLQTILNAGTKPFYRLGCTIESQPEQYPRLRVYPPKDFTKWGKICSHIISHYNDGWANGFHMGIEYWEIWNEPDTGVNCWTGTDEQFLAFYDAAATAIKQDHPEVKVGGCAFSTSWPGEKLLAHIRESGAPLDFFTWHDYSRSPHFVVNNANNASMLLHRYGFDKAESILDEWTYVYDWSDLPPSHIARSSVFGAAYMAAVMSEVQKTATDIMMNYDAQVQHDHNWNGLFGRSPESGKAPRRVKVKKGYYALRAWNELYKAGTEVYTEAPSNYYTTAAINGKDLYLLVTLFGDEKGYGRVAPEGDSLTFDFCGKTVEKAEAFLLDQTHDLEPVPMAEDGSFFLDGNTFALLHFTLA